MYTMINSQTLSQFQSQDLDTFSYSRTTGSMETDGSVGPSFGLMKTASVVVTSKDVVQLSSQAQALIAALESGQEGDGSQPGAGFGIYDSAGLSITQTSSATVGRSSNTASSNTTQYELQDGDNTLSISVTNSTSQFCSSPLIPMAGGDDTSTDGPLVIAATTQSTSIGEATFKSVPQPSNMAHSEAPDASAQAALSLLKNNRPKSAVQVNDSPYSSMQV